jgi:hypothetical protein
VIEKKRATDDLVIEMKKATDNLLIEMKKATHDLVIGYAGTTPPNPPLARGGKNALRPATSN